MGGARRRRRRGQLHPLGHRRQPLPRRPRRRGRLVPGARDSLLAGTQPEPTGDFGRSLEILGGTASLDGTAVLDHHDLGINAIGVDVTLDLTDSLVARIQPSPVEGTSGGGVEVYGEDAKASLSGTVIRDNATIGALVAYGELDISDSAILGTALGDHGDVTGVGDGVLAIGANLTVNGLRTEANARAGLFLHETTGEVAASSLIDNVVGVVLQGEEQPILSDDNQFEGNETDVQAGSELAVPDAPVGTPEPPPEDDVGE